MIWTADLPTAQKTMTSSHVGVAGTVCYPLPLLWRLNLILMPSFQNYPQHPGTIVKIGS